MALLDNHDAALLTQETWNEKDSSPGLDWKQQLNPVIESARFVHKHTDLVKINQVGVKAAARHIYSSINNEGYSPYSWRNHPLHLQPPQNYSPLDYRTKSCLNWIFLISSLNFSFWSEKEGTSQESQRFAVEWREGWGIKRKKIWTGYWSLVAAINKALEANIPITDPFFYSSKIICPDAILENVFRPAAGCSECVPLLTERISIMREVGVILVSKFGGSYAGLLSHFIAKYSNQGTALQLVEMIVEEFPPFRDEALLEGRKVFFWKRAQIIVAETWAAFYPPPDSLEPHPFFPRGIGQLTMFADYRVPQILHHLSIMSYPQSLLSLLDSHASLPSGCRQELSIRAASILAVEAVRDEIAQIRCESSLTTKLPVYGDEGIPSVMIDFFLWDLGE
ncbi:hypothetical protein K439DRAFT_1632912 [Ramaria rubella]|nr:hypothetical protein K439DRAFT_1632912 [Ramaria rubella]